MKKKIRLTESELTNLIKQVVVESNNKKRRISEQTVNPEILDTADAIYTIIATTIGLLGIAGYDVLRGYAKGLMRAGKRKEAMEMMDAIEDMKSKGSEIGEQRKKRRLQLNGEVKEASPNQGGCTTSDGMVGRWTNVPQGTSPETYKRVCVSRGFRDR
jgi:hypothetical protein